MTRVHSFHGGIHPPENKRQSNGAPIRPAPIPPRLVLPLSQHIGAPAEPLVKVGDRVLKGQVIAEPIGRVSVSLHAPTSGTVTLIGPQPVPHASGMEADCIVIETDGQDEWIEHAGLEDYKSYTKSELINYIRNYGIAGMGGAGFPTDVKLHLGDDHIVNTLIINAAECEPYITADDLLIRERSDEILGGIEVIAHLLNPSHILIGIEDNKPQAIRALEDAVRGCHLNIDVVVVPTKYPSGGEKQLVKLLTGVEVPSGKIPADVGIVCQNVGTASAIYRAVHRGEPLISRIVTITGDAVDQRHNLEVLIGTQYSELLAASGVRRDDLYRLVMGGPMMGFTMKSDAVPVVKTTNCIIAATEEEMPPAPPALNCIRCGMCEQVCPAELLPQQLHWFAKGKEYDKAKHHNLFDCIECGACSYVCPSNIPLVQYYRNAKAEIRQEEAEKQKAEYARMRFEARQARLEQEKIEKEQRRKARAEEAAKAQASKKDSAGAAKPAAAGGDVKALKTAAAVARTKLKKAEKAFEQAKESGADNLAELEAAFNAAKQKADDAQQKLEQAEKGGTAAASGAPDIKALKTAAAVARTKLKKAQSALKAAEEKGQDGVEQLRDTVKELETKAEAAQKAFDDAQAAPAPAAQVVDIKQLKTAAAVARTKLKQAEKALANAQDSGEGDIAELEAKVKELEAKVETTRKAFEAAEQGGSAPAKPVIDLAPLKEDMDKALAKVEKAEAAAKAAEEKGLPTAEKMRAGVDKLRGKYEEAKKAYEDAEAQNAAAGGKPAIDLAPLKEDMDKALAKVEKADAAAKAAEEKGLPTAEKMRAGVDKLRGKYEEAKKAYEDAEAQNASAGGKPTIDLAPLKEDMEKALAKVEKADAAAKAAEDKGLPTAEKMRAGVDKLRGKYEEAKKAFEDALAQNGTAAPAAPAVNLDELKADMETALGKVQKADAAAKNAEEKGLPTAEKMRAGVEKLRGKYEEAKQAYVAAGGSVDAEAKPDTVTVD
ncbi:electron transport complex subunit RsxC [Pontibacterium sp.]|uniref:electron transport complex subunit RsxC n=1 Tax=Pontibacterium sp. TaxID=2036026 RepID=UPI0035131618